MKFKILKSTELFAKLIALKKEIDKHDKMAKKLAIELGGDSTASSGRRLAGGIEAIHFKNPPDKTLWRVMGDSYQNLFFPKVKFKEAVKKIAELPTLDHDVLNKRVGFVGGAYSCKEGLGWATRPGMEFHKEYILMETPEGHSYKPIADMVEITVSEYQKLKKK
jgi:hypothetical protein